MRQDNPQLPFDGFYPRLCPCTAGQSSESEPSLLHLVSAEGEIFSVYREHALTSQTIRAMLAEPNPAVDGNIIYFPEIQSDTLEQICMYLEYKAMQDGMYMGEGMNMAGLNMEGLNMEGLNNEGLNNEGLTMEILNMEERLNNEGLNNEGLNMEGLNMEGLNMEGLNREGLNMEGLNIEGLRMEILNMEREMNMGTWLVPVFVFDADSGFQLLSATIFSIADMI